MGKYVLRRLLLSIPTLLAVLTIIFLLVRVVPGDPATAVLGDYASEDAVQQLRQRMGLDDPLYVQYFTFLGDLLRGDLGDSLITGEPVINQIKFVLPYSIELTIAAIIVGLALGIPTGVLTAVRRNTSVDYIGRVLSLAGVSFPAFYLGVLLLFVFGVKLAILPTIGAKPFSEPIDNLRYLVLPAATLGLIMTAYVTRVTRSVMLNVLSEDYVRTARAKGLRNRVVLFNHALRTAMIPIASLVGIFTISLVGSSVLTEVVFARPGLGKLMVGAVRQRDYTTLQSIMVVYAFIIVLINLFVDLCYGLLDPRVRYD